MIRRIFVEKKEGFDVEAKGLLADFRQNLQMDNLTNVRVLNRYDIEDIDDETYDKAKYIVFAEPAVDLAYDETMPDNLSSAFFISEYLPGQYDQRADSAEQCIKMINSEAQCKVRSSKVIALEGDVTEEDVKRMKEYYINPVESREAAAEKPVTLDETNHEVAEVEQLVGFIDMDDEALEAFRKDMGLAMSNDDIKCVRAYFKDDEDRDPFITEIKVIDTYWSDHCRHTTFQTEFNHVEFEETDYGEAVKDAFEKYLAARREVYGSKEYTRPVTLMDMACIGAKYLKKQGKCTDLDESEEINACSIKVKANIEKDGVTNEEDWLVMFKNETHNHPTEIEPFGGAATCLGGAIRDPLSGRSYVYQAMRVTGSADPRKTVEETLEGKLPQRKITQGAAAGYSSYGNQIGLATGQVDEIYHEGYQAKRMEIGAVIAAAPEKNVIRKRPEPGDAIILVGGRTGRDGCGGATGSSKEHTEESIFLCGAEVQKGNPPVERSLQRLFRREDAATLIKRCNDFGAGGVSVAIGELADSITVDLDLVPKKYDGLDGTELAISESQERMAVVVEKENAEKFIALAQEENLEATWVANVTDTGRFRMLCKGKTILDLSREFLNTNGASQYARVRAEQPVVATKEHEDKADIKDVNEFAKRMLADLNCCSKKGLIERFDSTIGAGTVLMPLGGKYQLSPAMGMAAKLPVSTGSTNTTTMMAYGFDPYLSENNPYLGSMYAVIDSVTKLAAMGGDVSKARLTFQEYFEKLTDDASWGKPFAAILGALKAQLELEIPSIGGKDSMSGTFKDINVPPTLVSFAVGTGKAEEIISTEFKSTDSVLVYINPFTDGEFDFDKYKAGMGAVRALAEKGLIRAASTVGKGGLFVSLVKMAAGNKIGATANVRQLIGLNPFAPVYGALVLELKAEESALNADSRSYDSSWLTSEVRNMLAPADYDVIGVTHEAQKIEITDLGLSIDLEEALKIWQAPLEEVFPVNPPKKENTADLNIPVYTERSTKAPAIQIARPKVIIPVFPGTNCEVDSRRAFERAGADVKVQIINNMSKEALQESAHELAKNIRESQIVMIPGGFSGGDEPDGSAKFIVALFRNEEITEAVHEHLNNKDGLMLGICNGFQALIKLGLVPYGKIVDAVDTNPTLTYNDIGRHQSSLIKTKIVSVKSPWMALCEPGDIHTVAISHGEGKFIADPKLAAELIANGQVATQYCDHNGNPSMDVAFNPNGSYLAIEGITSPDGRVLGKMGHSERIGQFVHKNVAGEKDQKIFEAGVRYFR